MTAERTVNVETAGDASAFLGLAPAARDGSPQNPFVEQTGETVEITLDNPDGDGGANATGVNANARTTFRNLVTVTNNGTQDVTSLTLEFISEGSDDGNLNLSDTFHFTASSTGADTTEVFELQNNSNILDSAADDDGTLTPGDAINFGIVVDLLDGGNDGSLPDDGSYTLQITAETADNN
ncbi:hypothetical protein EXE46_14695 [Halorubrum sp. GN11_10-6_MGM]|nr:hypothetical protein EXE46_14695 [Halorubrum sp. GN11_10-6_MGM]